MKHQKATNAIKLANMMMVMLVMDEVMDYCQSLQGHYEAKVKELEVMNY